MTNSEMLISKVSIVGVNLNHEPLVCLTANPYLGKFIMRQSDVKLSLGRPVIETTLHDADSGMKIYTARDEDAETLADAKHGFQKLTFDADKKSREEAQSKTKAIVSTLGYLE